VRVGLWNSLGYRGTRPVKIYGAGSLRLGLLGVFHDDAGCGDGEQCGEGYCEEDPSCFNGNGGDDFAEDAPCSCPCGDGEGGGESDENSLCAFNAGHRFAFRCFGLFRWIHYKQMVAVVVKLLVGSWMVFFVEGGFHDGGD
jgi:hypothetical protein